MTWSQHLPVLLIGFLVAFLAAMGIVVTQKLHGRWTHDEVKGVQKMHNAPTPRIGGIAIVVGLLLACWYQTEVEVDSLMLPILLTATIPFSLGLREDLLKVGSVRERMLSMILASLVFMMWAGGALRFLDIPLVDDWMQWKPLAILFTVFAMTGVTNAINIIDGFNGLASGAALIIIIALGAVALSGGHLALAFAMAMTGASILGFMVINYPLGKIFLGDAGAYLVGFLIACFAITLLQQSQTLSPWCPLVICAYPVVETLYSMVRRMRSKAHATQPDNLHLHTLIKVQLIRRYFPDLPAWLRNSLVSPFIWLPNLGLGILGYYFRNNHVMLMMIFMAFTLIYILTHRALLVLFKVQQSLGEEAINSAG